MSLGVGAYQLVEPGNALAWGGDIHSNPASGPHPGTVTLNKSVVRNTYRPTTYLSPGLKMEGRDGKNQGTNWHKKQQAIARTLCEELQASHCVYKSRGAPARGFGLPLI